MTARTESSDERAGRAARIVAVLRSTYPDTTPFLRFSTPLELLVATILSAQCTDKKVNEITGPLFEKYRSAADYAAAPPDELERYVRQTGFFRAKAKSIIAACRRLCTAYGGRVPDTMEDLVSLPGVARKTANIVLSQAYHKACGIAVDVHVKRLAARLGLSANANPDKIEQDLMALVPQKDWIDFNHIMVAHGRAVCNARRPLCPQCAVRQLCPSAGAAPVAGSGRKK